MKLRENMRRYVHELFGNDRNMLLLVIHCLHLVYLAQGEHALVFDAANQEAEKNKYCSTVGECGPGTHVMCMYGNTKVMGPRCAHGQPLPLENGEKELFLDIFNGFRRDLALGKEVFGKDNVRIPRPKNMTKLNWDDTLATFAQAWANQCNVQRCKCQSTEEYPKPGQLLGVFRFRYPDWTHPGSVFEKNVSALTSEKREFVIKEVTKRIYAARKQVTLSAIENGGYGNVYLTAVYTNSSKLGCAFSTYVDYLRSYDTEPFIYNAVLVVCNFNSRPESGEEVFKVHKEETDSGCCPEGFKDDNCLCEPIDITNDTEEKCDKENPDAEHCKHMEENEEKEEHSSENGDAGVCKRGDPRPSCRPRLVLMPVITVEDAPSNKLQPHKNQVNQLLDPTTSEQRIQELRTKIQERVQNVRDKFFKKCVVREPQRRLSDGGSVNKNTSRVTEIQTEYMEPNVNSKETELEFATNKKQNIDIQPKRDFSDLYDLLSAYLSYKRKYKANLQTNAEDRRLNGMIRAATPKVYVASVNGKPIEAKPVNLKHSLNFDKLIFGIRGFEYQKRPSRKVYISSVNGKPVYYNYTEKRNKLQIPNKRGFQYSVQDFKDKEVPYRSNLDDGENGNHQRHSISYTADKEIQKGDMMDQINLVDLFTDDEQRTEDQPYNGPLRHLSSLHNIAYNTNNIDFNTRVKNDHKHHIPQSMYMKKYKNNDFFYIDDKNMGIDSNEYYPQRNERNMPYVNNEYDRRRNMPYVYDKNGIRQYLNMLKRTGSCELHDEKSSDQSFDGLNVERDATNDQELEYVVPDRMNKMDSINNVKSFADSN